MPNEPKRSRDPHSHEALYSRSHRGSERVGEEEQEHDCSSLPQGERRGGYCKNDDAADKRQQRDMGQRLVAAIRRRVGLRGCHEGAPRVRRLAIERRAVPRAIEAA